MMKSLHRYFHVCRWAALAVLAPLCAPAQTTGFTDMVDAGGTWVAISNKTDVLASTNHGASFSSLFVAAANDQLTALGARADVVVAAGSAGLILRADLDANQTNWVEVNSGGLLGDLLGVAAAAGENWLAVGDGGVMLSTNEAIDWAAVTGAPGNLRDVVWNPAASNWVAVGGFVSAAAYTSIDGFSWSNSSLPASTPVLNAVTADGYGNILAVGEAGTALLSTNHGHSFSVYDLNLSENLNDVVAVGPNYWIIGGDQGQLLALRQGGLLTNFTQGAVMDGDIESLLVDSPSSQIFIPGNGSFDIPPIEIPAFDVFLVRQGSNLLISVTGAVDFVSYRLIEQPDLNDPFTRTNASQDVRMGPDPVTPWTIPIGQNRQNYGVSASFP
jgi:hypothetical protein